VVTGQTEPRGIAQTLELARAQARAHLLARRETERTLRSVRRELIRTRGSLRTWRSCCALAAAAGLVVGAVMGRVV